MNQAAALKRKVLNPNKSQSSMKNIGFDFQYRSSAELPKRFQIKREKLASDRNDKAAKEHALLGVKRKNYMPATFEGQSRQKLTQSDVSVQKLGRNRLPVYESIQSSSREDLNTSHNIASKGQIKQRSIQLEKPIQKQGMSKLPVPTSMIQSSAKVDPNTLHMLRRTQGEGEKQLDIQELQNCKTVKTNSVLPSMSVNQFLKKYGIQVGGEKHPDNHPENEVRFMSSPIIDEREIELDNSVTQDEVGDDEFIGDEDMNIDGAAGGTSEKKRFRGQTTCRNIHARSFEEREEVTFDKGQAVRPTDKRVSDLTNFLGTIARNPRFIPLVHTSWHAVSKDIKQRMWEYVNSKFLIPAEGEKWVMTGLRDAWKRHKRNIKKKYFDKNATIEQMLQNCPNEIPEVQFRQLIE
ncbi:hypothetical protein A4A49_64027 [Nicotiana attenuata]|uniref:Uncharacterized protein n=1 Tax=Nicotiana attenuata TaxID=49451 RepID=A0A314L821_NICAT|nr:hypothetical protein A4A49_64027 [Nicotiana attenuata]